MKRLFPLILTFIAAGTAAQQRPAPDPRVEVALSTTLIKETQRSVQMHKTVAPSPVRARPTVHEPDMARMAEGVYLDRLWVPRRSAPDDTDAVRVRPSDR